MRGATRVLVFSALFWLALYAILRLQRHLPFNPLRFGGAPWNVTFNTTPSFVTNTNWQDYGGETTMSHLSQMAGLAVQNFVSAAVGMAVLAAVIRGFARCETSKLGNFWVDLTRTLLYILLPLSVAGTLLLVSQGVVQTFTGSVDLTTLHGFAQSLALGPVASQEAIKQLGTNGGGFFNVNSSFPFENATSFSNFVELLFILLIPAAATYQYGKMIGRVRQGWALYVAAGSPATRCSPSPPWTPSPRSATLWAANSAAATRQPAEAEAPRAGHPGGKGDRTGIRCSAGVL